MRLSITIVVLFVLCNGCFLFNPGNHISGTVLVQNETDWANLKAGVFLSSHDTGAPNDYLYFSASYEDFDNDPDDPMRLVLSMNNDG
jgi:hypothetical protein